MSYYMNLKGSKVWQLISSATTIQCPSSLHLLPLKYWIIGFKIIFTTFVWLYMDLSQNTYLDLNSYILSIINSNDSLRSNNKFVLSPPKCKTLYNLFLLFSFWFYFFSPYIYSLDGRYTTNKTSSSPVSTLPVICFLLYYLLASRQLSEDGEVEEEVAK